MNAPTDLDLTRILRGVPTDRPARRQPTKLQRVLGAAIGVGVIVLTASAILAGTIALWRGVILGA